MRIARMNFRPLSFVEILLSIYAKTYVKSSGLDYTVPVVVLPGMYLRDQ